jgi:hypothetical protein
MLIISRAIQRAGLVCLMLGTSCGLMPASVAVIDYYDYGALPPKLGLLPVEQIHVEDLRIEVLSQSEIPGYVGYAKDGFGNRRTVINIDGCPLPHAVHSTEHCKSFAESVKNRLVDSRSPPDSAKGSLFILINDWHTDAVSGITLTYDLSAVHTRDGKIVERAHIKGQDEPIDTHTVGSIQFSNHEQAEVRLSRILVEALDRHLEQLIAGTLDQSIRGVRKPPL